MPLAVNLPKKIAIRNKRLAILHFSMVGGVGIGLFLFKFVFGSSYVLPIPVPTQLEIAWDMQTSIHAMENFFEFFPATLRSCAFSDAAETRNRWGADFVVQKTCTSMCAISDVTLHRAWNSNASTPAANRLCWTDFKSYGLNQKYTPLQFLGSQGGRAVSLITAKNDWVVDHAAVERTNLIEVVPQGVAGFLRLRYKWRLARHPPWFLFTGQSSAKLHGTDEDARTLILDATGAPWGDIIPAGEGINLAVYDVMNIARGDGQVPIVPWDPSSLIKGGQIDGRATCFNTDADIIEKLGPSAKEKGWSFGASLKEPVCVLEFVVASTNYEVNVNYGPTDHTYTSEVVSETTGYLFTTLDGVGSVQALDFNTLLIELTSMLVLLAIPVRVTSFIASRMLGPLSRMYRRVLVEPYDIEECTASTVLVLASNTSQFHSMKHAASDGKDIVGLKAIEDLLFKALEARSETMEAKEVVSLAVFCYDAMRSRDLSFTEDTGLLSALELDMGWDKKTKADPEHKSIKHEEGVSMDQFNQVRLEQERVTFDAVVQLFDKDRKRGLLETIFTPLKIQAALDRAADSGHQRRHWLVEAAGVITHSVSSTFFSPKNSAKSQKDEKKTRALEEKALEDSPGRALEEKALEECAGRSDDRVPHMLAHGAAASSAVTLDVAQGMEASSTPAKDLEDGLRLLDMPSEGDFAMTQGHTKVSPIDFQENLLESHTRLLEGLRNDFAQLAARLQSTETALAGGATTDRFAADPMSARGLFTDRFAADPMSARGLFTERTRVSAAPSLLSEGSQGWALAVLESFGDLAQPDTVSQQPELPIEERLSQLQEKPIVLTRPAAAAVEGDRQHFYDEAVLRRPGHWRNEGDRQHSYD